MVLPPILGYPSGSPSFSARVTRRVKGVDVRAFRFLIDRNRKYRKLWLDRERP